MYRVILVDDEPYGIEALRLLMNWEEHGYAIAETCDGGEEALSAIVRHQPHLVVTDLRMPGVDGLALIAQAKKLDGLQVQPLFVVMSGYHDFYYARQALHLGVFSYLTKPIMTDEADETLLRVRKKLDAEAEALASKLAPHTYSVAESWEEERLGHHADGVSIERVEQYVRENYRQPLTIQAIAGQFHYNPVYLGRAFAVKFGTGLLDYIHDLRIAEAARLLDTTALTSGAIAESVGYAEYKRFTQQFHKRFGMKPNEYKARCRGTSF